jgi:hypothetical protein
MQKQAAFGIPNNPITEAAFAASRQVWLAGLGAAVVTRDWARTEAGKTFRTLVKEGAAVESKAIRDLGKRVEASVATATSLLKQTRATVVTTANTIAENATAALSKLRPTSVVHSAPAKARTRKAVKATKKVPKRTARRVKRATR